MKTIIINNQTYEIMRNDDNCLSKEELKEKITDYFDNFDYIMGDFSYDKVRLKGYNDSNNEKTTRVNDIKYLDDYINNYCNYGSKIFLLKKVK